MSDMCTFMSISNIENLGFEIFANGLANINWITPKIKMQIQNKFEQYDKQQWFKIRTKFFPHLQPENTLDIFNHTYGLAAEYPQFCMEQTSFQFVTNTI